MIASSSDVPEKVGAAGSAPPVDAKRGDDHEPATFGYGHARMPFFMKVVWVGFLAFATWYVVVFLLDAVGQELGG